MEHVNWGVVRARVLALAGLFVGGGLAAGFVPDKYQKPTAAAALVITILLGGHPPMQGKATSDEQKGGE